MDKIENIVKEIGNLTVLELSQLVKAIEERFGVSATQPMVSVMPQEETKQLEEKVVFSVILNGYVDGSKIPIIKIVKDLKNMGLMETKTFVETLPATIMEGVDKNKAEEIKNKLEEVGGVVQLK